MASKTPKFDFIKTVTDLLLRLGARKAVVTTYDYEIDTQAGVLALTVYNNWLATRFEDVAAAKKLLGAAINQHTGKWNWHYTNPTAEDIAVLETHLVAVLPKASEPTVRQLCDRYGVAVYPVEALQPNPTPEEAGKFFVSTVAGTFDDVVDQIPLADTEEAGEALAVEHLGLRALYAKSAAAVSSSI